MTNARQVTLVALCLAGAVIQHPRNAQAGPTYDLAWKVFRADAIVEIELTVLPKSGGWKAANAEARKAKILRTVFKKPGVSAPDDRIRTFPFSNFSACWPEVPTKARFLVFYAANDDIMGLENDDGGYSSLNEDYSQIVSAVSAAARWSKDRDGDTGWAPQRKAVRGSKNRYLRGLALWFLKQQGVEGMSEELQKKTVARALAPEATCGPTSR